MTRLLALAALACTLSLTVLAIVLSGVRTTGEYEQQRAERDSVMSSMTVRLQATAAELGRIEHVLAED